MVEVRTGAFNPMFIRKSLLAANLITTVVFSATAGAQEQKAKPQVLFSNVDVFDGKSDKLAEGMSVLIEGNLIKKIAKGDIEADANAKVIDGGGRTLMPGLLDSHVHFNALIEGGLDKIEAARWDRIASIAAGEAQEWFMEGFKTVRGMGGMGNGLKMTIDEGILDGPRIYPSARYISQTSGHGDLVLGSQNQDLSKSNLLGLGVSQLADGPDAVRAAVRRNFANGPHKSRSWLAAEFPQSRVPCLLRNTLTLK